MPGPSVPRARSTRARASAVEGMRQQVAGLMTQWGSQESTASAGRQKVYDKVEAVRSELEITTGEIQRGLLAESLDACTALLGRIQAEEQRQNALDALRAEAQRYIDARQPDQAVVGNRLPLARVVDERVPLWTDRVARVEEPQANAPDLSRVGVLAPERAATG